MTAVFMERFVAGFMAAGKAAAICLGGVCAVLMAAAVLLLLGLLAGVVFDVTTWVIAKTWARTGRKPRSRLGKIIAGSVTGNRPAV